MTSSLAYPNSPWEIELVLDVLSTELIRKAVGLVKDEVSDFIKSKKNKDISELVASHKLSIEDADKARSKTLSDLSNLEGSKVTDLLIDHMQRVSSWSELVYFREMPHGKEINDAYIPLDMFLVPIGRHVSEKEKRAKIPVDEVLTSKDHNLVILGGAGAGKTTALRNFANSFLKARPETTKAHSALVLLRFRDARTSHTKGRFVRTLIRQELGLKIDAENTILLDVLPELRKEAENYLEDRILKALSDISAIVLLDGLDEAGTIATKGEVIEELDKLARRCPGIRFILTCRTGELSSMPREFVDYQIAPMTSSQINTFVKKWIPGRSDQSAVRQAIDEKGYSDVAMRPIILAYICSIYERTGDVPSNPRDLYQKMTDIMIEEWDDDRVVIRDKRGSVFNRQRKREFLERFAFYASFETGRSTFSEFDVSALLKALRGRFRLGRIDMQSVVQSLEEHTSLFVKTGRRGDYEFSHKTIQEFMAAEYLVKLGRLPKELPKGRNVVPELAMATALASEPTAYLINVLDSYFRENATIQDALVPLLERLVLEDIVLDGEEGGFDVALFAHSLLKVGQAAFNRRDLLSLINKDGERGIAKPALDIPWLQSFVEGDWEAFCLSIQENYRLIHSVKLSENVLLEPKRNSMLPHRALLVLDAELYQGEIVDTITRTRRGIFGSN
ncbi:NACHT domain-containing NTPase [Tateyamaria sp. syn59]|uniref:NACHT domain-containing protein n=1 Tax=Tateyamaria sp. syn59 TaxID=2576942 RepID=UPI001673BC58|nr:NACHT domain-containing protein [Tateyamaria sp. syn59]